MSSAERRDLVLCLGVSALLLVLVWAEPRPIDDLFIALAGGRDVLAGHLGTPDHWSFTTDGRVWVNQNWASHVLFYGTYAAGGETGVLGLKALLLIAIAAFVALAARTRGVEWPLAILVAGATLAAARSYVDLRPSLVGLALASCLLWILARAATRPRWIWLVVPLIAVWANAHGSFLFGLGLVALWIFVLGVATRTLMPAPLAALAAAFGLAVVSSPFGWANVTHPFVVAASPAWRGVAEWVPLFSNDVTAFGSRREACTFAGLWAALLLVRVVTQSRGGTSATGAAPEASVRSEAHPGVARGLAAFDLVASLAVLVMAVRARRFVPLALIVLAPPGAAQLAWWQRRIGRVWPTRALAAALLVAVVLSAPAVARRYRTDNPVFAGSTVFGRMVDAPTFPEGASGFLRDNGIAGRAYAAWEWEGFLRWTDAPVTILIGGRAQQVYDEATLQLHEALRSGAISARDTLAIRDVGLAIVPMTAPYAAVLNGLIYDEDSPWTFAYCDGRNAVLFDTSRPELAPMVAALAAGTLRYPTPASAATSRMMYLASPHVAAEPDLVRAAAEEAAKVAPTGLAYAVIGDLAFSSRPKIVAARAYLENERSRLDGLAADGSGSLALAQARLAVARVETALAARAGDTTAAKNLRDTLAIHNREMTALLSTWAYGWNPDVF